MEIGRVCMKLAGRDAGQLAVVIENLDGNFVVIDGNVRRKRCNILHLEPMEQKLEINEKASTEEVKEAMKKAGIKVEERKKRETPKEKKPKPKKARKVKKKEEAKK